MSLTIPCHSNHDALWGVSKGSGLVIWFQPFSNKTVCTRGLSVEIIILCSRTFAPKCAACLQPILPAEVSNGSLARDSLLLHQVYAVEYLYRNGSQVEFKFAWACTAVFVFFLLWLIRWIRGDGMWHWDYTLLSQKAVLTMLVLCFRAVRRFSGWYPWTKTITLSAITVRWVVRYAFIQSLQDFTVFWSQKRT